MDIQTFITTYLGYFLTILAAIILWKKGVGKELFESSSSLLKNKKEELENCQREVAELKEYNRMLHRNAIVNSEIAEELTRTIKELKDENWKLKR